MLDNFLKAGSANNQDFWYPLCAVKVLLDAAILAIPYYLLDCEVATTQYMLASSAEKLSYYSNICYLDSEGFYCNQSYSAPGWPPAGGITKDG